MITFATVGGIAAVFLGTLLLFKAFGIAPDTLLYTRRQKQLFDSTIAKGFSNWLFGFNVFGTLNSVATVYVFFIGTSKLFGIFIFVCPLSLFMGYAAVNYFTSKVMDERPRYAELLREADQVSAIFANAVWDTDKESQASARFLQVLSRALSNLHTTIS